MFLLKIERSGVSVEFSARKSDRKMGEMRRSEEETWEEPGLGSASCLKAASQEACNFSNHAADDVR